MDVSRSLLKHFLAALAYRTQKALRDAPPEFSTFRAGPHVRTPHELIQHMDSVLGYARTFLIGGTYRPPVLPNFTASVEHFHETLSDLARHLEQGTEFHGITPEIMLQGNAAPLGGPSSSARKLHLRRHHPRPPGPRPTLARQPR